MCCSDNGQGNVRNTGLLGMMQWLPYQQLLVIFSECKYAGLLTFLASDECSGFVVSAAQEV